MQKSNPSQISLREVPRLLLDSSRYSEIKAAVKTEIRVLQILNAPRPDRSFDGFWDAFSNCEFQRQRLSECGRELCAEFRQLMQAKKILCFGYPPASATRILIPHDREDLWPRFLAGKIVGRDIEFSDVIVVEAHLLSSPRRETLHAAEKFILTEFALGKTLDKNFKYEVRLKFPDLRIREIDVLFANLSGRKPGAPKRNNPAH